MVSTSLSKTAFTRPEKLFEENDFIRLLYKLLISEFKQKNVWQDGKTAITCPVEQW